MHGLRLCNRNSCRTPFAGEWTEVLFKEGEAVEKGQLVAKLEMRGLERELAQTLQKLAQVRQELAQLRANSVPEVLAEKENRIRKYGDRRNVIRKNSISCPPSLHRTLDPGGRGQSPRLKRRIACRPASQSQATASSQTAFTGSHHKTAQSLAITLRNRGDGPPDYVQLHRAASNVNTQSVAGFP